MTIPPPFHPLRPSLIAVQAASMVLAAGALPLSTQDAVLGDDGRALVLEAQAAHHLEEASHAWLDAAWVAAEVGEPQRTKE